MNDKIISQAIKCYIEKLEKENKELKDFAREICNVFDYHGTNETDNDRIKNIIRILRCYEPIFADGDING